MKAKLHIPTEQYGFIELEIEDVEELEQAKIQYEAMSHIIKNGNVGEGHNAKEWARVRNAYAKHGVISLEDLEKCNLKQQHFINEMKLVFKSIEK